MKCIKLQPILNTTKICGCVHRPPSMSLSIFNDMMTTSFTKIQHENKYPSSLSDIELSNIDTVRELLSIRDEVLICLISHLAAGTLIDDICFS